MSVQMRDDAMITVVMTVDTAWNNLPVQED
jgi:hypothetical protein